jgi:hypothetical protein
MKKQDHTVRKTERPYIGTILVLVSFVVVPSLLNAEPFPGYTLFAPNNSRTTYLLNMDSEVIHSWSHNRNGGFSSYLMENGHLLRPASISNPTFPGGAGAGVVQEVDWDGNLVWEYIYSNTLHHTHHDLRPLPNGHVLLVAWEMKTAAQVIQAGHSTSVPLWPDHIVEVQPSGANGGTIVWEWHAWDHLIQDYDATKDNYGVVGDHPELLDINRGGMGNQGGDWMHTNAIFHNPERDEILISCNFMNELYVIDHSTTTEEAAGHSGGNSGRGGDILYRWGNPQNYDAPGNQYFRGVHCVSWIEGGTPGAGHILVFNNGNGVHQSSICELVPPLTESGDYLWNPGTAYGPASPIWIYTASGFWAERTGSCQRSPNGNTLICESTTGDIFEVDSAGAVQWSYAGGDEISRVLRYALDYPGIIETPQAVTDLTITIVGNDVVLRWSYESGNYQFSIYSDSTANGAFADLVGTTAATTCTVVGAVEASDRSFFMVTANTQ